MSFSDGSFDFVLCKEACHHFPRPFVAIYEMLRVARKGIILIEPKDGNLVIPQRQSFKSALFGFIQAAKNSVKRLLNKPVYYNPGNYEEIGNYVYSLSEREIEKMALGINCDAIAFKTIQDVYIEGGEYEELRQRGPIFSSMMKELKKMEHLQRQGKLHSRLLVSAIFKEAPGSACIEAMERDGYTFIRLPKNPYIS